MRQARVSGFVGQAGSTTKATAVLTLGYFASSAWPAVPQKPPASTRARAAPVQDRRRWFMTSAPSLSDSRDGPEDNRREHANQQSTFFLRWAARRSPHRVAPPATPADAAPAGPPGRGPGAGTTSRVRRRPPRAPPPAPAATPARRSGR